MRLGGIPLATAVSAVVLSTISSPASHAEDCDIPASGVLSVDQLPEGSDVAECDAAGRYVDLNGSLLAVPEAGGSVTFTVDYVDDPSESFTITTEDDGTLDYNHVADDVSAAEDGYVSAEDEEPIIFARPDGLDGAGCDQTATPSVGTWKVFSAKNWYIGDGARPAGLTTAGFANLAEAGVNSWYNENSPCYGSDGSVIPMLNYNGTTTFESDMREVDGQTVCFATSDRDGASTIDVGPIVTSGGGRPTAGTCQFSTPQTGPDPLLEFDIRLNSYATFTTTPGADSCNGVDVQSTLTHELGHVYGMLDQYAHNMYYQTMYGYGVKCASYKRNLAKTDVLALRLKY